MTASRCAIYTRKSTEEGLDQAFNTLQAQREACEAYVLSQAGEGWRALPQLYDDGGFSGGNMERPGLARLLADIDAGKVDVVVVYKVDRLTRSLADFARIVDRFDAKGVSFVSVTQAFNTTTSMGRLTLNVLLSFAQFEREVTSERIRDKIAASKAKGMWMGGALPLGYDAPKDQTSRALVVNEAQAETVRGIFRLYLELRSVPALEAALKAQGVRSKVTVSKAGASRGGAPLGRGALYHLLTNRTYLGEVPHKDKSHPGLHAPLVDRDLFDQVQALLASNATAHRKRESLAGPYPLKGRLFDEDGEAMSPTFTNGAGKRVYRYYTSTPLQTGKTLSGRAIIRRAPAQALEVFVSEQVRRLLKDHRTDPWAALHRAEIRSTTLHLLLAQEAVSGEQSLAHVRRDLALRLTAGEQVAASDDGVVRIVLPIRFQTRGGRTWIRHVDQRTPTAAAHDRALVAGFRRAHRTLAQADIHPDGKVDHLIAAKAPADAYLRKLCRLAFLAPDIQAAVMEGRQPRDLNLERLMQMEIPLAWQDQRRALGFG